MKFLFPRLFTRLFPITLSLDMVVHLGFEVKKRAVNKAIGNYIICSFMKIMNFSTWCSRNSKIATKYFMNCLGDIFCLTVNLMESFSKIFIVIYMMRTTTTVLSKPGMKKFTHWKFTNWSLQMESEWHHPRLYFCMVKV